jgi:hypothetical protein
MWAGCYHLGHDEHNCYIRIEKIKGAWVVTYKNRALGPRDWGPIHAADKHETPEMALEAYNKFLDMADNVVSDIAPHDGQKKMEQKIKKVLAEHALWLLDGTSGKRADLSGWDMSGAKLSGCNLDGASLDGAYLTGLQK